MFKIERYNALSDQWTSDSSLFAHGCARSDNRWNTVNEAQAACDELVEIFGISRHSLRVTPIG
jgi:hypothetical protein